MYIVCTEFSFYVYNERNMPVQGFKRLPAAMAFVGHDCPIVHEGTDYGDHIRTLNLDTRSVVATAALPVLNA